MSRALVGAGLLLAASLSTSSSVRSSSMPPSAADNPRMQKLAPVLIVDAVEPCVAFWTEKLRFVVQNEVPGPDGKLIFASVVKDGVEIMYQTKASVVADNPQQGRELEGKSVGLFITVPSMADLDAAERAVAGATVVKARHKTFYGSTEFYVREPGGNVVGFAAF
jgi:uncharacterized glyoxalase superfamily protein PhnB